MLAIFVIGLEFFIPSINILSVYIIEGIQKILQMFIDAYMYILIILSSLNKFLTETTKQEWFVLSYGYLVCDRRVTEKTIQYHCDMKHTEVTNAEN